MTIRFLFIISVAIAILAGCAKPPVAELENARYLLYHAAEVGALDWAPGEYQLARDALDAAEKQMTNQQYRAAARTIGLAQRYAEVARSESELAVARQVALERQRAEKARLQEEQLRLQQELAEKQEIQRQRELEDRRQLEAQRAAARAASAANTAKPPPLPPPPVEPERVDRYEVRAGQNLAEIAGLSEVYGDGLLWPLIYRANRDQIKTPREIAPGQVLDIPRDKNNEELEAARQEALELNLF